MTRFLLLSALLLAVGCKSYPVKHNFQKVDLEQSIQNPYFSDGSKDYVYRSNIEVYGKTFGGIFIVKKLGKSNHRLVFTTELGNKLFDFTFENNDFKVNYVMDDLNKKMFIRTLKRDFEILIKEHPKTFETFTLDETTIHKAIIEDAPIYYYNKEGLYQIVKTSKRKEKVRFLFTQISGNFADKIEIIHSNINLKITLKSI
ncbi:hypothetical protein [Hyunsoonleella rubra]|uniref:Lipoprotein n=1 Tax=Hyunsoonleella rubra TaxID=1737062 RepID=A0ABW5TC56_9FLAO